MCVVAAVLIGIGIALDYRGLRRNAFWPHLVGIVVLAWGTGEALGDYRLGTLLCGIAFAALGVWLARSWHLAIGGLLVYGSLSSRDPSVGTLVLSGVLLVGVGIWLATSRSALRDWLAKRGLPAPQVD